MSRKKQIASHYEPRIGKFCHNFQVLDWASQASQRARFEVLTRSVELEGRSLLDVGCGLGDLWQYLSDHHVNCDYTGVDILEKMVQAARLKHPQAKFVQGDVFVHDVFPASSFDVVFCSGIFNLNLGNNMEFLPAAVERLRRLSRSHLVLNMLHKRGQGSDDTYFYYDPAEIVATLHSTGCQCSVVDNYLPNDFTLICTKAADVA